MNSIESAYLDNNDQNESKSQVDDRSLEESLYAPTIIYGTDNITISNEQNANTVAPVTMARSQSQ